MTWSSSLESSVETDYTDLVAEVKAAVEAVEFDVGASSFTSVDVTGFAQVSDGSRRKRRETGDVEATVDIYFTATTEVKESEADAAKEDDATFDDTVTGIEEAVQDALVADDLDILAADVTEVESDIVLEDEEEEDFEVSATVAAEYEQTKEYTEDPTATCDDPVEIDLVDDSLEAPVGCDAAEEVSDGADDAAAEINDAIADSDIATGEAAVGTKATVIDTFEVGSATTTTEATTTEATTTEATTTEATTTEEVDTTTVTTTGTTTSGTTTVVTTTEVFQQPPCETACTEDWSDWEPCAFECWTTQEEFETVRKVRFKCLTDTALETCYETERCFTDENKDATECPSIDEVATGLNVFDMQELNENGLGVLNLFVDFKIAITEKWIDDYSDPNSIQFNVKAAKYTGIIMKWFLFPGTAFVSLDAVSMTKVENGLSCSATGVPAIADVASLDALLEVTADDVVKNNPFIDSVGLDNRKRRDIDAAVTRALDQCEGSDLIVFHLRTRHQVATTFDYQLVTQRMLRITSNNP